MEKRTRAEEHETLPNATHLYYPLFTQYFSIFNFSYSAPNIGGIFSAKIVVFLFKIFLPTTNLLEQILTSSDIDQMDLRSCPLKKVKIIIELEYNIVSKIWSFNMKITILTIHYA